MERTINHVLHSVTSDYLRDLDTSGGLNTVSIEAELLDKMRREFEIENALKEKTRHWKIPTTLSFTQVAMIMAALYPICRISCAGENANPDLDVLAIYQTKGVDTGVYVTSEDAFREIASNFDFNLTTKDFMEVMIAIRRNVERKVRCLDSELIAVNNGIFNYQTKKLQPFTPDLVFITKSHVNYDETAQNIVIHNSSDNTNWDVEDWMHSLSDDQEIVDLLWEILGAIIRPNVSWNKSAWLYSEQGNNGKGTLCELMRQLCGSGAYASIPIADFSKDFALEPLTRASAIIVDENDVGSFVDRAANLKAIITNDVITINRKFKSVLAYQFYGFMVQCLNEFPRIKDKSDSFYRRQLFVPMVKCFTGAERKYIKSDYLHRSDVLEYVLHRVLNMDYDTLSEPTACKDVLSRYKEFNDPVREFFEEVSPEFVWDLLPFKFLYAVYLAWFKRNSPSGSPQGRNTFIKDIVAIAKDGNTWFCPSGNPKIRSRSRMDRPEPLIAQYCLLDWQNRDYKGNEIDKISMPSNLAESYNGLQRYISTQKTNTYNDDDDTTSASQIK